MAQAQLQPSPEFSRYVKHVNEGNKLHAIAKWYFNGVSEFSAKEMKQLEEELKNSVGAAPNATLTTAKNIRGGTDYILQQKDGRPIAAIASVQEGIAGYVVTTVQNELFRQGIKDFETKFGKIAKERPELFTKILSSWTSVGERDGKDALEAVLRKEIPVFSNLGWGMKKDKATGAIIGHITCNLSMPNASFERNSVEFSIQKDGTVKFKYELPTLRPTVDKSESLPPIARSAKAALILPDTTKFDLNGDGMITRQELRKPGAEHVVNATLDSVRYSKPAEQKLVVDSALYLFDGLTAAQRITSLLNSFSDGRSSANDEMRTKLMARVPAAEALGVAQKLLENGFLDGYSEFLHQIPNANFAGGIRRDTALLYEQAARKGRK